jgi:enoyl-CoA hydratase
MTVTLETRHGAAWITLERPEKLNALDTAMIEALFARLDEAEADDDAKVMVLRGTGRAFSAGYDLAEGEPGPRAEDDWRAELARDLALTLRVWSFPKPTIAAVQGWCLGGALDLAVACDLVVAADDARFGLPEIKAGSGPVSMLLPFVVGQKLANELILTGDHVDAATALRHGLVNRVVARDGLDQTVAELVARIAPTPLEVLRLTKQSLLRAQEAMGLRPAQDANLDLMAVLHALDTPEQREFDRLAAEQGLRAALAWRAERYAAPDA